MRECLDAQRSMFDFYAKHEQGQRLRRLSELLDQHRDILTLIERDFDKANVVRTGARGLSIESIFRCLLLKQILSVSYEKLAFHLSDSPTYRAFACLRHQQSPSRSALQATIRRIQPQTLQQIHQWFLSHWVEQDTLSMRVDSTVVDSNIAPPTDSQLLDDGVRVLSRLMSKSKTITGVKLRFSDQRKPSKSLAFRIFHAKNALYPKLLAFGNSVNTVLRDDGSNRAVPQDQDDQRKILGMPDSCARHRHSTTGRARWLPTSTHVSQTDLCASGFGHECASFSNDATTDTAACAAANHPTPRAYL